MDKIKLMFVEDNVDLCFLIQNSLEITNRYTVAIAHDGMDGLEKYHIFEPDVIVSDIMMPGMSGLEMVKEIRKRDHNTPIILVSGEKKEQADIVCGLQLGVDNYIQKPYVPDVLDEYIKALFRTKMKQTNPEPCRMGDVFFDKNRQTLILDNKSIRITTLEAEVLWMLWLGKGHIVERKKILNELWGNDKANQSRSLDVIISKLRKYFHKDTSVQIITIRNEGYRLLLE